MTVATQSELTHDKAGRKGQSHDAVGKDSGTGSRAVDFLIMTIILRNNNNIVNNIVGENHEGGKM